MTYCEHRTVAQRHQRCERQDLSTAMSDTATSTRAPPGPGPRGQHGPTARTPIGRRRHVPARFANPGLPAHVHRMRRQRPGRRPSRAERQVAPLFVRLDASPPSVFIVGLLRDRPTPRTSSSPASATHRTCCNFVLGICHGLSPVLHRDRRGPLGQDADARRGGRRGAARCSGLATRTAPRPSAHPRPGRGRAQLRPPAAASSTPWAARSASSPCRSSSRWSAASAPLPRRRARARRSGTQAQRRRSPGPDPADARPGADADQGIVTSPSARSST